MPDRPVYNDLVVQLNEALARADVAADFFELIHADTKWMRFLPVMAEARLKAYQSMQRIKSIETPDGREQFIYHKAYIDVLNLLTTKPQDLSSSHNRSKLATMIESLRNKLEAVFASQFKERSETL